MLPRTAATTLKFEGSHSMGLVFNEGVTHEADDILLRFRTTEQAGILLTTTHDRSQDRLNVALEGGRVRIELRLGSSEKVMYAGQSLNDDIYHSFVLRRRGTKVTAIVDDDDPVVGECFEGSSVLLSFFLPETARFRSAVDLALFLLANAHGKTGKAFLGGSHK